MKCFNENSLLHCNSNITVADIFLLGELIFDIYIYINEVLYWFKLFPLIFYGLYTWMNLLYDNNQELRKVYFKPVQQQITRLVVMNNRLQV